MAVQKEIETECPACDEPITLVDFDPEDKSDETGQDIVCPECGEIFNDWHVEDDGTLVIDAEFEDAGPAVVVDERGYSDGEEDEEDDDEGEADA